MLLLTGFLFLDFLLTYIGISLGVIREGNPVNAWLFTLPFWQSLGVRVIQMVFILAIFLKLSRMNRNVYQKVLAAAYLINLIVVAMHLYWIAASWTRATQPVLSFAFAL